MASVYLITPLTTECGDWLKENVSEDACTLAFPWQWNTGMWKTLFRIAGARF